MQSRCEIRHAPNTASGGTRNPSGTRSRSDNDSTWTATSDVPCLIAAGITSAQTELFGTRIENRAPYTFSVPLGTTVAEDDRIIANGDRFEVVGLDDDRSFATAIIVIAAKTGAA